MHGNFQLTCARRAGANNDPDIFGYVFSTKRFPPDAANRGHYRNPRSTRSPIIHVESDQEKRKALRVKRRSSRPRISLFLLWFTDVITVHRRELDELALFPTGDYDFPATLRPAAAREARK